MRFLLHLDTRSEMPFCFKCNKSFKVYLLKKCTAFSCIFHSRKITRSHRAVKRPCSESRQVSSELPSHYVNQKKMCQSSCYPPTLRGMERVEGRISILSNDLWSSYNNVWVQGSIFTELPDCSWPQAEPRLYQQLCMAPTTPHVLFTALRSLGAGVIGEKLLSPKQVRSESWGIFQSRSLQWWKTRQETTCTLLICGFGFQAKFQLSKNRNRRESYLRARTRKKLLVSS